MIVGADFLRWVNGLLASIALLAAASVFLKQGTNSMSRRKTRHLSRKSQTKLTGLSPMINGSVGNKFNDKREKEERRRSVRRATHKAHIESQTATVKVNVNSVQLRMESTVRLWEIKQQIMQ